MFVVLPFAESQVGDSQLPDTTFGYTTTEMTQMISDLNETQRNNYIWTRIWMDIPWPIVYGSFFYMVLMVCFRGTKLKYVGVLPWLGVIFDYIENLIAAIHMGIFPEAYPYWIRVGSLSTQIKWIVLLLAMVMMMIGGVYKTVAVFRQRRYNKV